MAEADILKIFMPDLLDCSMLSDKSRPAQPSQLSSLNVLDQKYLLSKHHELLVLYATVCIDLKAAMAEEIIDVVGIKRRIVDANRLALLLQYLYDKLLNSPVDAEDYLREVQVYREALHVLDSATKDSKNDDTIAKKQSLMQKIRAVFARFNWHRLFVLRLKRMMDTLEPLAKSAQSFKHFTQFVNLIDKTNPIFSYIAWIYYLPRLTVNLLMLVKHTLPGSWMTEEERRLGWMNRLDAQINKRWNELANDIVWCLVGLTNCFILTGPNGMYLTVGLYTFDLINAAMKTFVELRRHSKKLKRLDKQIADLEFKRMRCFNSADVQKYEIRITELKKYKTSLQAKVRHEKKKLYFELSSTAVIMLGMVCLVPALSFSPWFGLAGATIVLATCILQYGVRKYLARTTPAKKAQEGLVNKCNGLVPKRVDSVTNIVDLGSPAGGTNGEKDQAEKDIELHSKNVGQFSQDGLVVTPLRSCSLA